MFGTIVKVLSVLQTQGRAGDSIDDWVKITDGYKGYENGNKMLKSMVETYCTFTGWLVYLDAPQILLALVSDYSKRLYVFIPS